jgi:CheY-like chemotaxis protein
LSTRRILIVDDDEDLRAIVELSFESGGDWEVDTASDGTAALERAAAARPDVILLDWNMPGLDRRSLAPSRGRPRPPGLDVTVAARPGLECLRPTYSMSPWRSAAATAAALSLTPSFG